MFMLILGLKMCVIHLYLSHWDVDLLMLSGEKGLFYTVTYGIILSFLSQAMGTLWPKQFSIFILIARQIW